MSNTALETRLGGGAALRKWDETASAIIRLLCRSENSPGSKKECYVGQRGEEKKVKRCAEPSSSPEHGCRHSPESLCSPPDTDVRCQAEHKEKEGRLIRFDFE